MNQSFSPDQLFKLLKKSELIEHSISKEDLHKELEESFVSITKGTFEFVFEKHKDFLRCETLRDKLILRKLNDNIKKLYKDKQANRRIIIYQIKTLLEDDCPMWLYRTDISAFYGSIDRNRLLNKFKSDSILNFFSIKILEKVFDHPLVSATLGLPMGISVSATLSEIYMRPFDKWIRSQPGIYYYSRFVDDIMVFAYKKDATIELDKNLKSHLPAGLKQNVKKTKHYDGKTITEDSPLEFLGYKFYLKSLAGSKRSELKVSIASQKVKKIQTRIVRCFTDYLRSKNHLLLENRIKFLTGNYTIKSSVDGHHLKAGIFFNYSYVNDPEVFKTLNVFYYKILNSRTKSFGIKIAGVIPPLLKAKLARYSFLHGFENKVHHKFDGKLMRKISRCWI